MNDTPNSFTAINAHMSSQINGQGHRASEGLKVQEAFLTEKGFSELGLKLLSVLVMQVFDERPESTYKEVSEIIVHPLFTDKVTRPEVRNEILKEEQNIRRRIYDALNVLISAGCLTKKGKAIQRNSR